MPLTTLGLAPPDAVTLEVRGRRSGKRRRVPVLVTHLAGEEFLVALAGESEWVRNVRAAAGHAVLCRRRRRPVILHEVAVDQRAPVLAAYLASGRERSGPPGAAVQSRYNFGLTEPDLPRLAEIAHRYPVFRVADASTTPDHWLVADAPTEPQTLNPR